MSILDTQRKTDPGASQEAKTPQAADGHTSTVSTEVSMENAYLDIQLSNSYCIRCTKTGLCDSEACLDVILEIMENAYLDKDLSNAYTNPLLPFYRLLYGW